VLGLSLLHVVRIQLNIVTCPAYIHARQYNTIIKLVSRHNKDADALGGKNVSHDAVKR